ncbi:heterokaryon incompatibility protein-domain-containing protein [Phyllosticta citriasiana]|uniref:heterokaryon incompatibility protein-domain-containing protein n=1 Tax=Phyllosticta citriasiana TaxID=595635 RepID=UPI0030FDD151
MSPSACSAESFEQLRAWVERCSLTHSRCNLAHYSGLIPSRLLEIKDKHPGKTVSLVLSHECHSKIRYMTLSHCWGTKPADTKLKLSADTFQALRQGILLGSLTKTFRDAFETVALLDLRFLWIDSLCIFQDSKEDWTRESALMHEVYRHSFLDISAHASSDDEEGCFFNREDARPQVPGMDPNLGTPQHPRPFAYKGFIASHLHQSFGEGSICQRGWILQERLLALRTVHFGKTQLFWECNTYTSCKVFPADSCDDYDYWASQVDRNHTWKRLFSKTTPGGRIASYEGPGKDLFNDWTDVVEYYSVAGIANDVKSKLQQLRPRPQSLNDAAPHDLEI